MPLYLYHRENKFISCTFWHLHKIFFPQNFNEKERYFSANRVSFSIAYNHNLSLTVVLRIQSITKLMYKYYRNSQNTFKNHCQSLPTWSFPCVSVGPTSLLDQRVLSCWAFFTEDAGPPGMVISIRQGVLISIFCKTPLKSLDGNHNRANF